MKFIYIFAVLMGIYMYTTDSGQEMYQSIRAFIIKPVDKANAAKDQMETRNNKMQNELDEIVDSEN
jgi:hypothetical protein